MLFLIVPQNKYKYAWRRRIHNFFFFIIYKLDYAIMRIFVEKLVIDCNY
jgi:hypothetical protein